MLALEAAQHKDSGALVRLHLIEHRFNPRHVARSHGSPHAPDAWIDPDKTKIGYEIPFNRHFYVFEPPRPLAVIDAELRQVTGRIQGLLATLDSESA